MVYVGISKILSMKVLAMLEALPSIQAQREHLRIYVQIEVLERGKVGTWSDYT